MGDRDGGERGDHQQVADDGYDRRPGEAAVDLQDAAHERRCADEDDVRQHDDGQLDGELRSLAEVGEVEDGREDNFADHGDAEQDCDQE